MNFRRTVMLTICLGMCVVTMGSSVQGEDALPEPRKATDRDTVASRFTKALPSITDVNWGAQLPERTTEVETGRFSTLIKRVPDDVHSIFSSEFELSPAFLVSMDINCDTFSDLAAVRQKEQRISEPLVRRIIGASIDLRVKADFLKLRKTSDVKVTVRTLAPGTSTVDPNCYVWYAPVYDDRLPNRRRFGPISSPSVDMMPPGTFAIWTVRQGKEGHRDRINIVASEADKDFDIESPGN